LGEIDILRKIKTMKVKDLIEILRKLNPEAEIIAEPTESMKLKEQYSYYENGWEKEDLDKED
jgi:hypothetical protein